MSDRSLAVVPVGPVDFDALYTGDPDPWEVGSSWYEQRKIDVVLACLRRPRYRRAWDAGCGTGHLAARLADRCDQVNATDVSPVAAALAAARTAGTPQVTCGVSALPDRPQITEPLDLIVLSEVLYYLDEDDRCATYDLVDRLAAQDADVIGVHWWPQAEDYRVPGVQAHRELGEALTSRGWTRVVTHTDEEFLAAVWSRSLPAQVGR
ncbi:SAM-dependent methyltransferase [Austwickia chelonae]|uniref:SAM-dependent methyltransferase n=1 Tax=Austwickia chelonae TaxID=100225 RepID=UPI000E263BC3|nr:SAM-dependent methyltransferase [Austwickia chelonae]